MAHNKWTQPKQPPPPLFTGKKERDLVKQINDELIERVIGQAILYYPISMEHTKFHSLYGEAIEKSFYPPIRVHVLVDWEDYETTTDNFGVDRISTITVKFHKKRLTEDQNLFVRIGDFVYYDGDYYEIVETRGSKRLFGQDGQKYEISATCIKARENMFNG